MGNGENKESKESQANKKSKENKMGVMPVKKLIINMSVPMMISMLVQALYNVVDSIFVAKLSEGALTAVTLAFPMQNLIISVAFCRARSEKSGLTGRTRRLTTAFSLRF